MSFISRFIMEYRFLKRYLDDFYETKVSNRNEIMKFNLKCLFIKRTCQIEFTTKCSKAHNIYFLIVADRINKLLHRKLSERMQHSIEMENSKYTQQVSQQNSWRHMAFWMNNKYEQHLWYDISTDKLRKQTAAGLRSI